MSMRPTPGPRRNLKPDGETVPPPGTVPAGEDLVADNMVDRPEPTDLANANKRTILAAPGEPPAPVQFKLSQGQARLLEAALLLMMGPHSGRREALLEEHSFSTLDEDLQEAVIAAAEKLSDNLQR